MRHAFLGIVMIAFAWPTVHGAGGQNPPPQPPATPQQGQPGQQGRGGGQRANFPQQQRPPGDPALIARGRALYGVRCTACHGADMRGGDQGGPNLLRSQAILTDQKGENIMPIVREGRQGAVGTMPAFNLPENDLLAIVEYIHSVMGQAGRQGRPPARDTPIELNVLVGNAAAGQQYFERVCSRCHDPASLRASLTKAPDARTLQDLWVSGGTSGRGGRGGGGGGRGDAEPEISRVVVTVTPPGGAPVKGRLVRIDDFIVSLVQDDGTRRTFRRDGAVPKVELDDPLEPHRRIVLELGDPDMHNVTAYLATLK